MTKFFFLLFLFFVFSFFLNVFIYLFIYLFIYFFTGYFTQVNGKMRFLFYEKAYFRKQKQKSKCEVMSLHLISSSYE